MSDIEPSASPEESEAAIAVILARTGMPVSDEERERLVRLYPVMKARSEHLRMIEARYADPAMVFPAAPRS
jgi:hypothetical protein